MQEGLARTFESFWRYKEAEESDRDFGTEAFVKEAFMAGAKAMEDIANAYSRYVMEFMEKDGPCYHTGNSPVCLGEWLDSEESANALKSDPCVTCVRKHLEEACGDCPHRKREPEKNMPLGWKKLLESATQPDIDLTQADVISAFQLGFWEGNGDVGMTYNNDTEDPRSVAYDMGRNAWRTLFGLDEDDHPRER